MKKMVAQAFRLINAIVKPFECIDPKFTGNLQNHKLFQYKSSRNVCSMTVNLTGNMPVKLPKSMFNEILKTIFLFKTVFWLYGYSLIAGVVALSLPKYNQPQE
jgi:hypothetical protein